MIILLRFSLHPSVRASADALARLQAAKAERSDEDGKRECENECVVCGVIDGGESESVKRD